MNGYDGRLIQFARDRAFVRLKQPLANRREGRCDACNSLQPRVLHGLKDEASGRYVFVGGDCLRALVERGSVGGRIIRERTEEVYERELALRCGEKEGRGEQVTPTAPPSALTAPNAPKVSPAPTVVLVVAVVERAEYSVLLRHADHEHDVGLLVHVGEDETTLAGLTVPLTQLLDGVRHAVGAVGSVTVSTSDHTLPP